MKKWKRILVFIFIIGAVLFFWYIVEKDRSVSIRTLVESETVPVASQNHYYMKIQGSHVIVYNKDDSIYEYTDLEPELLPDSLLQELYQGKYFKNQEELYEFLETYTS